MSDEQIKQRIAYLVEHGGIADDPIADIRRNIKVLFAMNGLACAMGLIGLFLLID